MPAADIRAKFQAAKEARAAATRKMDVATWADMNRHFTAQGFLIGAMEADRDARALEEAARAAVAHLSYVDGMFAIHTDEELIAMGFDVAAMRAEAPQA